MNEEKEGLPVAFGSRAWTARYYAWCLYQFFIVEKIISAVNIYKLKISECLYLPIMIIAYQD